MKTFVLSIQDIRTIVDRIGLNGLMDETIDALTQCCEQYNDEEFIIPARRGFEYSQPRTGLLEWMPAYQTGHGISLKVVGYHPSNPSENSLPTILSVGLNFDTVTGHLIGLVDGTFSTAIRTGAASAIASRILAKKEVEVLGLVGAGVQAISQLHGLSRLFRFKEVLLWDIDQSVSDSFKERAAALQLEGVRFLPTSLDQVCRNADILCTATSIAAHSGPVFQDLNLKPWLHVNAIGSDFAGKTEVPYSLLKRSLVCPDFLEQAMHEGDCQQLQPSDIGPDLVELVKSQKSYDPYKDSLTVFDSTGWALEDHVIIGILMHHANILGCGTMVQLESISDDPRDPYGFLRRNPFYKTKTG